MKAVLAELHRRATPDYYDRMSVSPKIEYVDEDTGDRTIYVTIHGKKLTFTQAGKIYGIKRNTIKGRYLRGIRGDRLVEPVRHIAEHDDVLVNGKFMTVQEIGRQAGVPPNTVVGWVRSGVSIEEKLGLNHESNNCRNAAQS